MEKNDSKEDEPGNFPKIFNVKSSTKEEKERMLKIVKRSEEEEIITKNQSNMIEKILELDTTAVDEIMVHRIDIKAVEQNSKVKDVLNLYVKTKFSKILVFDEDIDSIIGVVYINDIIKDFLNNETKELKSYVKKIFFVPESMKCSVLYKQLTKERKSLAVVVDEYGGTSGIVGLKNIKNLVFNELEKEHSNEENTPVKLNEKTVVFSGTTDLKEVGDILKISIKENENYDTIGGFLVDVLGKIPEKNEHPTINYEGVEFKILSVDKQHIDKVQAIISK